jgi:hypothetical protein
MGKQAIALKIRLWLGTGLPACNKPTTPMPKSARFGARAAWCLPVLLCLGSLAGSLALTIQPPVSGPVALIFPPWWNAGRAMLAAAGAGAIVRFGAAPFIVVIIPGPGAPANTGAWLRLDPLHLGGCGPHHP